MSIAELKNDLIQLAIETDNPRMLEKVIAFFRNLQEQEDWMDALSEEEQKFLQLSSQQIAERKIIPRETVRAEAKRILNKM